MVASNSSSSSAAGHHLASESRSMAFNTFLCLHGVSCWSGIQRGRGSNRLEMEIFTQGKRWAEEYESASRGANWLRVR